MNLWTENKEDLTKGTAGADYLNKSGVYKCKILDAQIVKAQNSNARALQLNFATENEENFRVRHFFEKKDGSENEFVRRIINQLVFLLKKKHSDIKPVETDEKITIPTLINEEIGVIVEVALNGDYVQHNVKTYFDIKSKKTADEITNKKNAEIVARFEKNYENAKPVEKPSTNNSKNNEELPEEFPF